MASNLMLTYGGVTPCQALLGYKPRELYDFEAESLASRSDLPGKDVTDFVEIAMRMRLMAKECILAALVEEFRESFDACRALLLGRHEELGELLMH